MGLIDERKMRSIIRDINWKDKESISNEDVINELNEIIKHTDNHLKHSTVDKTINWILFKDLWLENEEGNLTQGFYNYSRGDIVLSLNLGTTNIGTEIRYPHPCVVLYDNEEDWIVVAPITAARIDNETQEPIIQPFEVYVEEQKKPPKNNREFHFRKKSVIQVDQITRVSKYRAVNRTRKKLRTDLLNQIDNIILENYIPLKHKLLEKLKETTKNLSEQLESKNCEIDRLQKHINELEKENQAYKSMFIQANTLAK